MANLDNNKMLNLVRNALEDMKSQDMMILDVRDITTVTDNMIIVTGTSTQHLRSMVNHLKSEAKKHDIDVLGSEGEDSAEWILLDLGNVIVHAMLPEIRQYYEIEKLWSVDSFPEAASA
jgi:ribosome-associated protein